MKILFVGLALLTLTGCASTVTTFDSNGQKIGSCESKNGFGFTAGGAHCTGRANQEGRN